MRMKKRIMCVIMTAILLMLLAAGCASKLSAKFEEGEVQEKAEKIAELSCTGKSAKLTGCSVI